MDSLGARIRKLRKERKLTLEALAADRLTKGMLSQIENDKAKPSMESLDYIAERLGVKASELLEQVASSDIRHLLEQVENMFNEANLGDVDNHQQIIDAIQPYIDDLPLSYEAGRLFYMYAYAQYVVGCTTWQQPLLQARQIFKEINLWSHWFKTFILQLGIFSENRQYNEAYRCILQVKEEIDRENYQLDSRDKGKVAYYISIFQLAIGEHEAGKQLINETIAHAHQNQLFSHIDDLYRIGAYCAMIDGDFQQADHMMMKLEQYRIFVEQADVDAFIYVLKAHYYNNYKKNYEQALVAIEHFNTLTDSAKLDKNFYYAEKGKALYLLGRYTDSQKVFKQFTEIPILVTHPYDLLSMNECLSYKALCYAHFGELTTAYEIAKQAYMDSIDLIDLPYKQKIEETYFAIKDQIDTKHELRK